MPCSAKYAAFGCMLSPGIILKKTYDPGRMIPITLVCFKNLLCQRHRCWVFLHQEKVQQRLHPWLFVMACRIAVDAISLACLTKETPVGRVVDHVVLGAFGTAYHHRIEVSLTIQTVVE